MSKVRSLFALFTGASAAALTLAAPAQAQDTPATSADEIVVTASKRSQTLLDVPISVAVTTAAAIEQANVRDLLDLQSLVPSLREYTSMYGLTPRRVQTLQSHALVMHPGPINRGVEITVDPSDLAGATIVEQVTNGIAVRMAVLFDLLGSGADIGRTDDHRESAAGGNP
jgi:aspartate carbamoyltransferase catalytic subunit